MEKSDNIITRAIVLDDSASVRSVLEYGCRAVGWIELKTFAALEEAAEAAAGFSPDVAWCDIGLPGNVSGLGLLDRIDLSVSAIVCSGREPPPGFAPNRYWKYVAKGGRTPGKFFGNYIRLLHYAALYLRDLQSGSDTSASRARFMDFVPVQLDASLSEKLFSCFARERSADTEWEARLLLSGG